MAARPALNVDVVHVVVPVHDEESLLAPTLEALARAGACVRQRHQGLAVRTTLVLDRCTDGSEAVARGHGADVVLVDAGCVGAARGAGLDRVAVLRGAAPAHRVWVASTDADTVVPDDWLLTQVERARHHDLLIGPVRPDPQGIGAGALAEWERRHPPGSFHVHGANLGFRLSAYQAVGGFAPVPEHEDVLLVSALQAAGFRWSTGPGVVTSSRTAGRTPGGFAGYLAALSRDAARAATTLTALGSAGS